MSWIEDTLEKEIFSREDLIALLSLNKEERNILFRKAASVKEKYVGKKVYFRGLIELSNICSKDCYYCGIRKGNINPQRYSLTDEEVVEAAVFAWKNNFASIVIQAGELSSKVFTERIFKLLTDINLATNNELGITLSLGEQSEETYRRWMEASGRRYLLRIETSNRELYKKLHPANATHDFGVRLAALQTLKRLGYQTGTGVMIGLPFQTIEDLADDLLFFRELDIDMAGMGPYIEHEDTPLWQYRDQLWEKEERFYMSLKMVALLRIMFKDINIAATTAMQTLDPQGREKALMAGANVIMPNLTPVKYREGYLLYQDKPCIDEEASQCQHCLEARIKMAGDEIGYGEWGDSPHWHRRLEQ
jgi:biotin synthase